MPCIKRSLRSMSGCYRFSTLATPEGQARGELGVQQLANGVQRGSEVGSAGKLCPHSVQHHMRHRLCTVKQPQRCWCSRGGGTKGEGGWGGASQVHVISMCYKGLLSMASMGGPVTSRPPHAPSSPSVDRVDRVAVLHRWAAVLTS